MAGHSQITRSGSRAAPGHVRVSKEVANLEAVTTFPVMVEIDV